MSNYILDFHCFLIAEIMSIEKHEDCHENSDVKESREQPEHLVSIPSVRDVSFILEELQMDTQTPYNSVEYIY